MATIARLTADLVLNSAKYRRDLNKVEKKNSKFFKKMQKSAKATGAVFMAAAGAGVAAFTLSAIKGFGDFEESISDVQAKTNSYKADLVGLRKAIRAAAKETKFNAKETGEAATFLAQAGLNLSEIEAAILPTLNLAAATRTGVAESADIVTNVLKGMALDEEDLVRVSDTLAQITASANTNLIEIGEAYRYASAGALGFGMTVEDTNALLGAFANMGLKGSIGGNAITQSYVKLSKSGNVLEKQLSKITGVATKQDRVLQRLKINVSEDGEIRNLIDIIKDVAEKKDELKRGDIAAIFGVRPLKAIMPLIKGGVEQLTYLQREMDFATGAAERMAKVQLDNLPGDILLMKSAWVELKNVFVEGGLNDLSRRFIQTLTKGINAITPMIKKISPYLDEIAVAMAAVTGAAVIAGLGYIVYAFGALAVSIGLISLPVTAIAIAIAGVSVLLYKFRYEVYATFELGFKRAVSNAGTNLRNLQQFFGIFKDNVKATFRTVIDAITGLIQTLVRKAFTPLFMAWDALPDKVKSKMGETGVAIQSALDAIDGKKPVDPFGIEELRVTGRKVYIPEEYEYTTNFWEDVVELSGQYKANLDSISTAPPPMPRPKPPPGQRDGDDATPKKGDSFLAESMNIFDELAAHNETTNKLFEEGEEIKWGNMLDTAAKGSKAMAAIQKGFALKSIIMDGAAAIMKAWNSAIFPANLPAVALTGAAVAAQISTVIGQAHDGIDNVPNTGTYLLESGERVVDKRLNRDLSQYLATQSASNQSYTDNRRNELNFNVQGGSAPDVEEMLLTHRGKFESLIRDLHNENGGPSPF